MLLIRAWRSGEARLSDNERALANIAKVSLAQWRKHSPAVMAYWRLKDGFWTQKRLTEVWEAHAGFKEKQKQRAKNSQANRQKNEKCFAKKPNENNETTPANAVAVAEAVDSAVVDGAGGHLDKNSAMLDEISDALGNAGKPNSMTLYQTTIPLRWTIGENAVDFDLDLIPTIRRLADRAPPRSIRSWEYFREAVFTSRDIRLTPNSPPKDQNDHSPRKSAALARDDIWNAATAAVMGESQSR